ncbi:hypothetical protein ADUPG1_003403, partial [Aduncisulcus paluster]
SSQRIEKEHALDKALGRRNVPEAIQSFVSHVIDRFLQTYEKEKKKEAEELTAMACERLLKRGQSEDASQRSQSIGKCDNFCIVLRCAGHSCAHGLPVAKTSSTSSQKVAFLNPHTV